MLAKCFSQVHLNDLMSSIKTAPSRIRCDGVAYRQGFIEVIPGIHGQHINLETWNVHPDMDLSDRAFGEVEIPEGAFIANTELELSVEQAKALIEALQASIHEIQKGRHHAK